MRIGLVGRGHDVTLVVPTGSTWRAWSRNLRGRGPDWVSGFRPRVRWVRRWSCGALPDGDVIVATAWQSAGAWRGRRGGVGASSVLVQHYESLYHGNAEAVDATYRLPLEKIVISTWLKDVMRERFEAEAEVLVTPVDRGLFHPVPVSVTTSRTAGVDAASRLRVEGRGRWAGRGRAREAAGARPAPGRLRAQAAATVDELGRVSRQPAAGASWPRSTAGARSTCVRPGTRDSVCRRWRPWRAGRRWSPTTTAAAATTRVTARRRWWPGDATWTS